MEALATSVEQAGARLKVVEEALAAEDVEPAACSVGASMAVAQISLDIA